jgi:7-cyano-7-deazaguanine synthase
MPASKTQNIKAVVLLSGGMDSCICAAIAMHSHGAEHVALLHAGYGQRTQKRERQAFESIADFYDVQQRLVVQLDHFRAIGGSALTDGTIAVPEHQHISDSSGANEIPVTYVPFRNAHFLSVAVSWAEVIGAHSIYIGRQLRLSRLPPGILSCLSGIDSRGHPP